MGQELGWAQKDPTQRLCKPVDRMVEKGQVLSSGRLPPSESEAERWQEGLRGVGEEGAPRRDPCLWERSRREPGTSTRGHRLSYH